MCVCVCVVGVSVYVCGCVCICVYLCDWVWGIHAAGLLRSLSSPLPLLQISKTDPSPKRDAPTMILFNVVFALKVSMGMLGLRQLGGVSECAA